MKKLRALLPIMLASVFAVTSCGVTNTAPSNSDSVTLTIMGKRTDLKKDYMVKIFERYENETGNKLDIISIDDDQYETAAAERLKNGEMTDIFLHFHNADLNRFDVEGNFCYLNNESWVSDLTDGAREYCTDAEGNLLGLPFWENSVSGCYYNKTLLDSLGLKSATTQAEFDMLCEALTATGYTPICWPAEDCAWMPQFALDPIFADDPDLLEKLNSGEITYSDIPEVKNMAQWISDAADKGWFGSDYLETGWDDISPAMSSGGAVMTFIWDTWFYTDLEDGGKYTKDDFALMPVFMNTVDGGTFEGGNINMMMVNKNSDKMQDALDFLSFCADAENYNAAFDGIATVSCFKGQTSNVQSDMVTDILPSVEKKQRVSTAASRIVGYSADDMVKVINELLSKRTDVEGCVRMMDEYRRSETENRYADETVQ